MTLTEEQVVVDKEVVPKERIRLDKDVVVEEQQVTETVAREEIEVEGDVEGRGTV
jgi:stress response protein YsnF